ncbi:MAG: hypothetical protein KDC80_15230 [Saprospiraceae bacterium]|nr:hypothetical protein [Saprospiraceae bacterium]
MTKDRMPDVRVSAVRPARDDIIKSGDNPGERRILSMSNPEHVEGYSPTYKRYIFDLTQRQKVDGRVTTTPLQDRTEVLYHQKQSAETTLSYKGD